MFSGMQASIAGKLIGLITGLMVVIRIAELVIDPILGNIVSMRFHKNFLLIATAQSLTSI